MANQFRKINVAQALGFTPISSVSDAVIWTKLLTPQTRALLGAIKSCEGPYLRETTQGLFPGDEVTNLNDHRLYGGQGGFVRFPYLATVYRTEYGAMVVKRDAVKFKVFGWFGNIDKGNAQLIYKGALRDRRFDGTLRGSDTALLDFKMDDPDFNRPLPQGKGVELSIYGFLPGTRISETIGDAEYEAFVANPFTFLDRPELFRSYFDKAWNASRAPGQIAAPIPDISRFIASAYEKVAARQGYDFIENGSSHYHVAMWSLAVGYRPTYEADATALAALSAGMKNLRAQGLKLNRVQESWACVVQSLRLIELIPPGLYFGGAQWPQNNIDQQNLWMNKPLSEAASKLLPGSLSDGGSAA